METLPTTFLVVLIYGITTDTQYSKTWKYPPKPELDSPHANIETPMAREYKVPQKDIHTQAFRFPTKTQCVPSVLKGIDENMQYGKPEYERLYENS